MDVRGGGTGSASGARQYAPCMREREISAEPRRRLDGRFLAIDEPRYALVLVIALALYVSASFLDGPWVQSLLFGLAGVAVVAATLPDRASQRTKLVAVGAVGLVLAVTALNAFGPAGWTTGFIDVSIAVAMIAAGLALILRFIGREVITPATVFGAIDVYLLVGLAFSFLYHGMQSWSGDPFFASGVAGTRNTFTYFSFVSLTTLGYGDFTPASDAGRSLAVVEVVIGQILLITVIARLVSIMRGPRRPSES